MKKIYLKLFVLLLVCLQPILANAQVFSPKDADSLYFFVESVSIVDTLHVANCKTQECFDANTDQAPINLQYCDTDICAEGCVRYWPDNSPHIPTNGFKPPSWVVGREYGQDDHEKPCYINNCINGKPCVRGGAAYADFKQDKYHEIEIKDLFPNTVAFSLYLLCKPVEQPTDYYYLGNNVDGLRHNVSSKSLTLRVRGSQPNIFRVTEDSAVKTDMWQLIEVHRDNEGKVTVFINGEDKTKEGVSNFTGLFDFRYVFSDSKSGSASGTRSMYGDIASVIFYGKNQSEDTISMVRNYLRNIYNYDGKLSVKNTQKQINYFSVYPNPSSGTLSIKFNSDINFSQAVIRITDVSGRVVDTINVNDISSNSSIVVYPRDNKLTLSKGVYFVLLQVGNNKYTQKIVIR